MMKLSDLPSILFGYKDYKFFLNIATSALLLIVVELTIRIFFYLSDRAGFEIGRGIKLIAYVMPLALFLLTILAVFVIRTVVSLRTVMTPKRFRSNKNRMKISSI